MNLDRSINRFGLRAKILVLLLIPLVGLSLVTARDTTAELNELKHAKELGHGMQMEVLTGLLMHETQRERGLTSLFLGSSDTSVRTQLDKQRVLTDAAFEKYDSYVESHLDEVGPGADASFTDVNTNLDELASIRQKADQKTISGADAAGWYTALNAKMLKAMGAVVAEAPDAEVQRSATVFLAWANAKEQTGIERARLVVAFSNNKFAPGQLAVVTQSMGAQQGFIGMFKAIATPEDIAELDELMAKPVWSDVTKFEQIAVQKGETGGFGVSSAEWFTAATAKIDAMGEFEQEEAHHLMEVAGSRESASRSELVTYTSMSLVLIAFSVFVGLYLIRTITRRLSRTSQRLQKSSRSLSATGNEMRESADLTTQEAVSSSAASEQVSASVQTISTAVEELTVSITEISMQMSQANSATNTAVGVADSASSQVAQLGDSSSEIGKVLDVITAIAQQTNLLALNATIEAARAGEAGKGFAVVANEVKELASETARATEEISARVSAIQNDASGAVSCIEEISTVIASLSEIQSSIAGAVEEQSAAVSEIALNLSEAAGGTATIAQSVTSVASRAELTSVGAQSTQTEAAEMFDVAAELAAIVNGETLGNHVSPSPDGTPGDGRTNDPNRRFRADRPAGIGHAVDQESAVHKG